MSVWKTSAKTTPKSTPTISSVIRQYPDGQLIPPSLPARYRPREECSNCAAFAMQTYLCSTYNATVKPEYVCDTWISKAEIKNQ